ncbi:MAG: glycoside hydrolase family 13 protein [Ruminococcaceae bacterium]|nr:glycoside hydrolase family 13 protein [Oscillospiraceae bacterium]
MLIKLSDELISGDKITLTKYTNRDASLRGAFSVSEKVNFTLNVPRSYGVRSAVMRFHRDGEGCRDIPFITEECGRYTLTLDMSALGAGLYYYSILLLRGLDTLFTDSVNNVDFNLVPKSGTDFRMLVYSDDFETPEWFKGGVMYHTFIDRFYKSGKAEVREDAENENDWFAPISQYGVIPGASVKNDLFYGGDLFGISEKLDYLEGLGVNIIYLSPIFCAASNHKYDTADYLKIDDAFGGEEAFCELVEKAREKGMRVILDGVFNHTGDDSIYFNRYGKFPSVGAYQSEDSPYRNWYFFDKKKKAGYECWWDIDILPKLNHKTEECRKFFTDKNGVCTKYVGMGTGGWRLDVADELSDDFLHELRQNVKSVDPDAVIIGEVWENAADKIAYGNRRSYFQGKQLDSVMNYPFRTALLEFILNGDSKALADELTDIYSSYPKCVSDCLMNIIGTHDTERIITVLGDKRYKELSNKELSDHYMTEAEYDKGIKLMKIASLIQYTVYGVPSVFYGDEVGLEGGRDPFCRRTYPWGRECKELLDHYKKLAKIRRSPVFVKGDFKVTEYGDGYIVYQRTLDNTVLTVCANMSDTPVTLNIKGKDMITGKDFIGRVAPISAVIIK